MKFCPECGASLAKYMGGAQTSAPSPAKTNAYDQDEVWREILKKGETVVIPPAPEVVVDQALDEFSFDQGQWPARTLIHILFDRSVTPEGGILHAAILSEGKMKVTPKMLSGAGYVVDDDKIVQRNGVPVGKICRVLDYWAGDRQYRRWGLEEPVSYDPSRSGSSLFMDERMIAISVLWQESALHAKKALVDLLSLCSSFGQETIGLAVAMKLTNH